MPRKSYAVLGAVLLAAAMWTWVQRIAIPHQQTESAARNVPRGNLSDLYPRWLGARELLLHGRDPYSADITREIQTGYYGRPLHPNRPNDPKDQQGFAYPVYVVFVLAPTIGLPFPMVQRAFLWLLLLITAASVPLWRRALGLRASFSTELLWIVLTLGCFPAIQGFKLQQLTLLVAALIAAAMFALATEHFTATGILLAFASIKPHLVAIPMAWVCLWALGNWRERQRLLWSMGLTMVALIGGGEFLLPGWIHKFRVAAAEYWQYTGGGKSILDVELTPFWGRLASAALVGVMLYFMWKLRMAPPGSGDFCWMMVLVMATTLAVIPMFAPYNQLILLPALMLIVHAIRPLWRAGPLSYFLVILTVLAVFWPWLAAAGLVACLSFLPGAVVQRAWALPLYTNFAIPILVLALLLFSGNVIRTARGSLPSTLQDNAPAE
ncbi:MAG TPA: hypothetical protein VGM18_04235 [Candidatus Sulfotelmatobacter sp.]|jgi:hypothetical protein